MSKTIRIAGGQGFYGDSPMAAIAIAKEGGADYIVNDALAELTLSILQKDRMKDPETGYAKDILLQAKTLYPLALSKGIKVVTNSGGLNPLAAAKKVAEMLAAQGLKGIKIAALTGDNVIHRLDEFQEGGENLANLDSGIPFSENTYQTTHANVYVGAKSVAEALNQGAQIILAGRVADPCLTLGVLVHEFGWDLSPSPSPKERGTEHDTIVSGATEEAQNSLSLGEVNWNKLASGIAVGHLLECGGQASGGNSYAEWPMDYPISNLGYPIAEVSEDGTAVFSKLDSQGGKMSRDTLREQLVYEIHDPANYMTPDVTVDLTNATLETLEPGKVKLSGVKGKPRPEKLKLTAGLMEGYMSDQFFFFSAPYAYEKVQKFIEGVKEIWSKLPIQIERSEFQILGVNGMHGSAAPMPPKEVLDQMNEIGVRLVVKHSDNRTGKMAFSSIICLGLNGPPGIVGIPGWGKQDRVMLSLWPTLIDRKWIKEKVEVVES